MNIRLQLAVSLFAFAAGGCHYFFTPGLDDAPDAGVAVDATKRELLSAAPWTRTGLWSDPAYDWYANGVARTDILAIIWPCERDDSYQFRADGYFDTSDGPTTCDPRFPQESRVVWWLTQHETKLVFDGQDTYTLVDVTPTTLMIESTFVENGVSYTHVETYSH